MLSMRFPAAVVAAGLAACIAPDPAETFGQVDLALVGQAENGAAYRLRDAAITVTGPAGTFTFDTEANPDRTAITQRLAAGTYSLALGGPWRLERLGDGGPTPVTASLLSANPQGFVVLADMLTRVALRFGVPGGEVELGEGDLEIGVDVDVLPAPDVQAIVPGAADVGVSENASTVVSLRLAAAPAADTEVVLTSADPARLSVHPARVVFTPQSWSQPQFVQISGLVDDDVVNDRVELAMTAAGIPTATIGVTVVDVDRLAIQLQHAPEHTVDEGQSLALGVRLSHRPTGPSTVTFTADDAAAVAFTPATLTFTPDDWSSFQAVSLQALPDADTANESVLVSAALDGATTVAVAVTIVDTSFSVVGWAQPGAGTAASAARVLTTYRMTTTQPFQLHRLQAVVASTPNSLVRIAVYSNNDGMTDGGPEVLQDWVGLQADTTLRVHTAESNARPVLPPGTYWLALWATDNATVATAADGASVRRCRSTSTTGFPVSIGPSQLTCDQAPAAALAALGFPQ
jgi:hypothetical protein